MTSTAPRATMEPFQGVLFTFFALGLLGWIVVGCVVSRREVAAEIRKMPEYRCLAAAAGRDVRIAPKATVKLNGYRSYGAGTLVERRGTDCIPDGDAVTYVLLPTPAGDGLVRIPGRDVRTQYREPGAWADVVGETGERWRNDGDGYRSLTK